MKKAIIVLSALKTKPKVTKTCGNINSGVLEIQKYILHSIIFSVFLAGCASNTHKVNLSSTNPKMKKEKFINREILIAPICANVIDIQNKTLKKKEG